MKTNECGLVIEPRTLGGRGVCHQHPVSPVAYRPILNPASIT